MTMTLSMEDRVAALTVAVQHLTKGLDKLPSRRDLYAAALVARGAGVEEARKEADALVAEMTKDSHHGAQEKQHGA